MRLPAGGRKTWVALGGGRALWARAACTAGGMGWGAAPPEGGRGGAVGTRGPVGGASGAPPRGQAPRRPLAGGLQQRSNPIGGEAGVDHQRVLPALQRQEPAVRVERVVAECLEVHGSAMLTAGSLRPVEEEGQRPVRVW